MKKVKIELTISTNGKGGTFVKKKKKKNVVHEGNKKNKTLLKG